MAIDNANMEEFKFIDLIKENGEKERVEVLLVFEIKEFNKEYFLYTKNELDEDNNVLIYSSGLVKKEDGYHTSNISTEEEWDVIKELIRQIIRQEGD